MSAPHIVALAGGGGGAKFARGLSLALPPGQLTVISNIADDVVRHGLYVSPDTDSVMYAIAGLIDTERHWGLAGESWNTLDALRRLGEDTWFQLGDRDIATHLMRTEAMRAGRSLSDITTLLTQRYGVAHAVVPMSDQPVRTVVDTGEGRLPFQDYLVRRRAEPEFRGVTFEGIADAAPSAGFRDAVRRAGAILIAPSNPYVSIDPILALPGAQDMIRDANAPVVAISPIVSGAALKGPLAKMMRETGIEPSALAVARHYGDLVDGWVIDETDRSGADTIAALGRRVHVTGTVMHTDEDKTRLARETVQFALELSRG